MLRHNCSKKLAEKILASYKQSEKYSSLLEKEFVEMIEEEIGELNYSFKEKQYSVWANNKINFYDIVHNGKAIEFNGDYWHCNPATYSPKYLHPHGNILAEQIWINDDEKIKALKSERNIEVLVIWESDFKNDKNKTIKRCVEWLK